MWLRMGDEKRKKRTYLASGSLLNNLLTKSSTSSLSSPNKLNMPIFTASPLTILLSRLYVSPKGCSPESNTQKYRHPSANRSTAFVNRLRATPSSALAIPPEDPTEDEASKPSLRRTTPRIHSGARQPRLPAKLFAVGAKDDWS